MRVMQRRGLAGTPMLLVAAVKLLTAAAPSPQLHRIAPGSPEELRALFRHGSPAMPLLSAHRGGAQPGYPENCIATFEHTLRHTPSILEVDLQLTKDGHIVLHHDARLERTTTGTGRVADRTLEELKRLRLKDRDGKLTEYRIPTLDEALVWARGRTVLILDKKDVPVPVCVRKIEAHQAEAYAMIMAYSFADIRTCYRLNHEIMMEVMIGDRRRYDGFEATGVPWSHVVAFVGHTPPKDRQLLEMVHAQGACCMAGTSRNLDRQLRGAREGDRDRLADAYRDLIKFGVDVIETDLPVQVGRLLREGGRLPEKKRP